MKYVIDLSEDQQILFMDGRHTGIITPEKQEMVVFDGETNSGCTVKLKPYDEYEAEERGYNLAIEICDMNYKDAEESGLDVRCGYVEAKAKLKAWKESKEKFRIGDEAILWDGRRFIVGTILSDGRLCGSGIGYHGVSDSWSNVDPKSVTKGRHFPEFEEMLKRLSEC